RGLVQIVLGHDPGVHAARRRRHHRTHPAGAAQDGAFPVERDVVRRPLRQGPHDRRLQEEQRSGEARGAEGQAAGVRLAGRLGPALHVPRRKRAGAALSADQHHRGIPQSRDGAGREQELGNAMSALKGWTSTQRHVVLASYLGWTLDAFDFLLLTLVAKDVAAEFHTPATTVGSALLLTLAARPIGAFIFGRLADRFGRRPILQIDVLLYSALAFASAFSPNITVFLILRGLFGVAMGGEWGIGSSLTFEHIKPEARGMV